MILENNIRSGYRAHYRLLCLIFEYVSFSLLNVLINVLRDIWN